MYHHSESPEVIHAKLAEWERTVDTHRAQCDAERLLANTSSDVATNPTQSLIGRLQRLLQPAAHMHTQTES